MPNIAPWQMIPTALLAMDKRREKARAWGQAQRAVVARQWGDAQREKVKALTAQVYRQFQQYARPATERRAAADRMRTPLTPTQMGATGVGAPITPEVVAQGGPPARGLLGRREAPPGPFAAGLERAAPVAAAAGDILGRGQQAIFGAAAPIVENAARRGTAPSDPDLVSKILAGAGAGVRGEQSMGFESLLERAGVGPGLGRTAAGVAGDIVIDPVGILPIGKVAGLAGKGAGLVGKGARAARGLATADRAMGAIAPGGRRMFHGTGSAFDVPDAAKFDANGLFGPGYYLTSDARVAGSYATTRAGTLPHDPTGNLAQLRSQLRHYEDEGLEGAADEIREQIADIEGRLAGTRAGPNIRAIDVPPGVNLLDAEAPLDPRFEQQIRAHLRRSGFDSDTFQPAARSIKPTNYDAWQELARFYDQDINSIVQTFGYDGIKYAGGKRIPMADDTGKAIEHDAVVIFPEAMAKLRNAISGTAGGITPSRGKALRDIAPLVGPMAAGGVVGATAQPEDATLGQRVLGGAAGAVLGASLPGAGTLVGGRLGAVAKGLPKGAKPIVATAAKEVERLRLDKFPDWARPLIEEAAQATDFATIQRRGVVPEAVQTAMGEAPSVVSSVDDWIRRGKVGKAYNTEELRALKAVVLNQAGKVQSLAATVAQPNAVPPADVAKFVAEGEKLAALTAIFEGGRAEWGRAGAAFKAAARTLTMDPDEAVARIYKKVGSKDEADKLARAYAGLVANGADIFQQAAFWAKVEKPPVGVNDWFETLRYNSMLSGPRTFEVIAVSNAAEMAWKATRDTAVNLATGNVGGIRAEFAGAYTGLLKGVKALPDYLRHGLTQEQALSGDTPAGIAARLTNPIAKGAASVLEVPGRALGTLDVVTSAMVQGMEVGRLASKQAGREGLTGAAWRKRMAELVADPPTPILKAAALEGQRAAMRGEMGTLGKAIGAVARVPVIGHILMPFARAGYNIAARATDRSPAGLVGTGVDVLRGAYKGGDQALVDRPWLVPLEQRLADNLIGTAFFGGFYALAASGNLTAGGVDDAEKRAMDRAEGRQSYSIKIGDQWVSYANWGPAAYPMAAAAAIHEAVKHREPDAGADAVAVDALRRWAEVGTEMTYLQTLGDIYKAATDPARYGYGVVANMARTVIPFGSAVSTVAESGDPVVRSPERFNLGQSIDARLPGRRQTVPPAQDILGRSIPNERQGIAALNPARASTVRPDAVIAAYRENGVDIGFPPSEVGNQRLTDAERREYQRVMGEHLTTYATRIIAGDAWKGYTPVARAKVLERTLATARERAKAAITKSRRKAAA